MGPLARSGADLANALGAEGILVVTITRSGPEPPLPPARVAHLGTALRIAGQRDGGMRCGTERNPLMTFARMPDGGVW